MYIRKWKHLMFGIVILISIAIICACNRVEDSEISSIEVINLKGIKSLENIVIDDENMLLVYPADARVSQEYTIVREVTKQGVEVSEYRIKDENFKRVKLHQKPSNRKTVYMTTFGEPILEDRYYTFNTSSHNITKHDLDYFDQKVGISHINHFGDNVLFQTIASHVTGDQAFNSETGEFKVSISDFSTQKGYETEYGYLPSGDSILGTNRYIYYSTTSKVNEDGEWGESYIAVIDKHNDETQYISYSELGESGVLSFHLKIKHIL